MRGTKHDASQHQRRGIRSRLIASVAAVAMLATSIAAGTAVAADIDETDPTQQNTIVEQPQQGTENAGDQTGEQNTESEGEQTTPSQEPGDTATEAESDNTAEADSTEEADPKADADKADDNQPQGAADNGQSAEKQSAAVPAPLAANAAADSGVSAQAEGDGDSITVNMFDYTCQNKSGDDDCKVSEGSWNHYYWQPGDYNAYTSGINKNHDFKFLYGYKNTGKYKQPNEPDRSDTWNVWTDTLGGDYRDSRYPGIMQDTLRDGSPVLNVGKNKESLSYLFDPQSKRNGVTDIRRNVQGLITKGSDGYYEYDSDKHSATLSDEGNTVSLEETTGKFMPFGTADQYFGMTVESRFYMPEGGMVGNDPMKFEFSGDDDVWVFIDDRLVLDLGGIHDKVSGSIDFSTGDVVTLNTNGDQTSKTNLLDTFGSDWKSELSGKRHTLKMFYLERGGDASNCRIRFNMPQVPSDQIQIAKRVTGAATQEDLGRDYQFKVYVDSDGAGPQLEQLYTGGYTVNGNHVDTGEPGVISVPANQQAVLDKKFSQDDSVTYRVVELSASTGGFTVSANDADGQSLETTANDEGTTTDSVSVAGSPLVTVTNTKPLGVPGHSKKIGKNDDGTYTLNLDVIGQNTEGSETVQTTPLDIVLVLDASGSMDNDQQDSDPYINSYEKTYSLKDWETYYVRDDGGWHEVSYQYSAGKWGYNAGSYRDPDWRYFTPMTSAGDTDSSLTQFYTMRQITKMKALQDAAGSFVDSVAALNGDNRIALVKFSGEQTDTIGNGTYQYYGNTWNYTQVVQDLTKVDSSASAGSMKSLINALNGDGGTRADYGLDMASKVLNGEQLGDSTMLTGAREDAQKVVIFFTDGQPTEISDWSDSVASDAVSSAYDMKQDGTLIYSVGVVSGANPSSDPTSASNINKFLHAVSSNYPNAKYTSSHGRYQWDFGQRVSADKQYYFAASDASQLSGVFNDIFEDVQTGASYSNVAIVDELSQWAQVDPETVKYKTETDGDGFHEVTSGVTLKVQKPGNDSDWVTVNLGDDGYPDDVRFLYKPAADVAADSTGTVKAVFGADYKLRQGWKYTLEFKVVPTDAAYRQYADSGYNEEGDEGTDLYTDETNTPKDGVSNTSAGKPGFHSNKQAYVEYTSAGKPGKAPYDHPVLQVDVTPVTIGSKFGLQEKKTVIGASAGQGVFGFTVTATGDNAKEAAVLAGWTTKCSDDVTDGCYTESDSEVVYSFTNPNPITDGDSEVVRQAGNEDGATTFTPDMVGRTFTYVYAESDNLPDNWYNQSDVKVWTVTATVDYADDTKSALKVTVRVYHGEGASGEPADTYVYTSDNPKPTHTAGSTGSSGDSVPTVSFTNTYVAPVSSLPLTGGNSTARTLLLAGGGVLLVAGAAWLLARRRRV